MLYPETGERVPTDPLCSGQPPVRRMIVAESGNLSRRAHGLAIGEDPEAHQQPRVDGRASGRAFHGAGLLAEGSEIQFLHHFPDGPRRMVVLYKGVDIHRAKEGLAAIDELEARLGVADLLGCRMG